MAVVLTRVDNRLIHGQVVESWVPYVKADAIVVANDEAASDSMKKALMKMAVPTSLRVQVLPVQEVAAVLASNDWTGQRVLLLFAGTGDALQAHRKGVAFSSLNLGNLHGGSGKVRYSCTICLDEADIVNLQALEEDGVRVVAQCVPADREQPLSKLCRCEVNFE